MFKKNNQKKIFFTILIVGLFTQFFLSVSAQKLINWNYHTAYDSQYYNGGSYVQTWADMVWEETNQQLKINIFYNGTLGYKGNEILSSLRDGLLDSAEFSAALYSVEANQPWWQFNDFYAMYDDWEQLLAVDEVAYPMFENDISEFGGVKTLALYPCVPNDAYEGIWMNKKIEKWEDFRGTKIRIFFSLARKYCFDPLGFETLFLSGPETYQGLQTGLVDGAIQTPLAGLTNHYYEIADYFYAFEPIVGSWWGLLCSQKSFNDLPVDVQKGLIRASEKFKKFLLEELYLNQSEYAPGPGGAMAEKDIVDYFKQQGVTIVRAPLLTKKVQEQNEIGIRQWIEDIGGPNAQKMYDTLLDAKKKYPGLNSPVFESLEVIDIKE